MSQAGKLMESGNGEVRGSLMTVCRQKEQKDNTMAGKLVFAPARISKGIWQVGFQSETVVCVVSLGNCWYCSDTGEDFSFCEFYFPN